MVASIEIQHESMGVVSAMIGIGGKIEYMDIRSAGPVTKVCEGDTILVRNTSFKPWFPIKVVFIDGDYLYGRKL